MPEFSVYELETQHAELLPERETLAVPVSFGASSLGVAGAWYGHGYVNSSATATPTYATSYSDAYASGFGASAGSGASAYVTYP